MAGPAHPTDCAECTSEPQRGVDAWRARGSVSVTVGARSILYGRRTVEARRTNATLRRAGGARRHTQGALISHDTRLTRAVWVGAPPDRAGRLYPNPGAASLHRDTPTRDADGRVKFLLSLGRVTSLVDFVVSVFRYVIFLTFVRRVFVLVSYTPASRHTLNTK